MIGWFINLCAHMFQPLILIYKRFIILFIIIGYVYQFIGHCLIPLDPCIHTNTRTHLICVRANIERGGERLERGRERLREEGGSEEGGRVTQQKLLTYKDSTTAKISVVAKTFSRSQVIIQWPRKSVKFLRKKNPSIYIRLKIHQIILQQI